MKTHKLIKEQDYDNDGSTLLVCEHAECGRSLYFSSTDTMPTITRKGDFNALHSYSDGSVIMGALVVED